MALRVECINSEKRVSEVIGFPGHAVQAERACKVIDDSAGGLLPSGDDCRKDVVVAFTLGNAVKPVADRVLAPYAHDPPSELLFSIF
jgi:hypothetical protein